MKILQSERDLRTWVACCHHSGEKIGFVPTMGYLHTGHLSLMSLARRHADRVIVSIFVNPTQFNDPGDFAKYPIDLERDFEMLRQNGVDAVFTPDRETVYGEVPQDTPGGFQSWVTLSQLPNLHEGEFRPGHFKGVSTVVAILFNLVRPDSAVFGEKDFQQLRIIEQMVCDLKFDIEIVRGPLIRENDGLAMSSRNVRLSEEYRKAAVLISEGLFQAKLEFEAGERSAAKLCSVVGNNLQRSPLLKPEYVRIVEEETLKELEVVKGKGRILVAAYAGQVRLIDNIALN